MAIKYGKKHGNGYHGNTYQKIKITLSNKVCELLEYEQKQLKENGNIIFEKEYYSSWVERTCPDCFTLKRMVKIDGVYLCEKCGIIKVPLDHDQNPNKIKKIKK